MTPVGLSALGLGGERRGGRWGWEEGDESKGGSPWEQPAPPNICQTSTHTHLGNQVGARGPGGDCRRLLGADCRLLRLEEEEPSKSGWC